MIDNPVHDGYLRKEGDNLHSTTTPKQRDDAWFKKKQKERNRIEGGFGHGKEQFGLARVRYKGEETSEVWVRVGLMAMNLMTARKRA